MSYHWNHAAFEQNCGRSEIAQHASGENEPDVRILSMLPARPLRGFIQDYSCISAASDHLMNDALLGATLSLDFILTGQWRLGPNRQAVSGSILRGPLSSSMQAETRQSETFSIALTPLGWSRFCGQDASQLADKICPANMLFGRRVERLASELKSASSPEAQAQVADAFFLALASPKLSEQEILVDQLQLWLDDPETYSVEQFGLTHGMTPAKLGRVCRRAFGFTPKFLVRRARFLRMLDMLMVRPYEEWRNFLDPLYVDQSHFIRDFHSFMGMAPNRYLSLPHPVQAEMTAQRRLLSDFDQLERAA
jgi:AraC-like DNA-binding protein